MKKIFVLDTSVILYDPQCIFRFEDNQVVIPITCLEEMDRFKKELTEIGRNARQFARYLDDIRGPGIVVRGLKVERGKARESGRRLAHLDELGCLEYTKRQSKRGNIAHVETLGAMRRDTPYRKHSYFAKHGRNRNVHPPHRRDPHLRSPIARRPKAVGKTHDIR